MALPSAGLPLVHPHPRLSPGLLTSPPAPPSAPGSPPSPPSHPPAGGSARRGSARSPAGGEKSVPEHSGRAAALPGGLSAPALLSGAFSCSPRPGAPGEAPGSPALSPRVAPLRPPPAAPGWLLGGLPPRVGPFHARSSPPRCLPALPGAGRTDGQRREPGLPPGRCRFPGGGWGKAPERVSVSHLGALRSEALVFPFHLFVSCSPRKLPRDLLPRLSA